MKKLLSLLSVLTISGVAPLIESSCSCSNKNNEKKLKKDDENDINKLNWGNLGIEKINRVRRNAIINNKYQHVFKTNGSNKPTEQQIKEKVKELNPQVNINKINVTEITENSAVITITGYSSKKTINFTVDKSVPINDIIKITHLGEIDINEFGGTYDEQLFKYFLKKLNSQLDINKINVTDITASNNINVNSNDTSIYTGEINITYSRPIKLLIKNLELGSIKVNNYLPTEQQIKDKLKEKNPQLKNNIINYFEVKDITSRNAKISFIRNDILSGEVVVNFISNINLNKIITQTNLCEFITENLSNPTEQQIKEKVKELNPILDETKIKVENISNNRAHINSSDTNTYTGHIIVDYTVSIETLNW
ncbi:hypothetical protein [Spiroplasma endosymbiont of Seladonia tumulorum]|uniref:hypothetical protein n=1 Tax=Spiroplasma endosymbiont of Seladonia tumulorum TaxID=3066321 RepID=UPI0030CE0953